MSLLEEHVRRFNEGVRTGDFTRMAAGSAKPQRCTSRESPPVPSSGVMRVRPLTASNPQTTRSRSSARRIGTAWSWRATHGAVTEAGKRARCGFIPATGAFAGSWSRSDSVVRPKSEGGDTDEPERTLDREREPAATRRVLHEAFRQTELGRRRVCRMADRKRLSDHRSARSGQGKEHDAGSIDLEHRNS